ncbi:SRPBCC family protein [Peterkaempfera griseoplana]|uniref:SRPBCC family protein n=1 Tax=Peterkaempfera griseoplana TaxID=66896 RepID=UPI0006E3EE9F|nr:SRPBCC family protein [Peterkaempfera griseoplana]
MAEEHGSGTLTGGLGRLVEQLPTDRLREQAQDLAGALGERAAGALAEKVDSVTGRLTEYAQNPGSSGLSAALTGGRALAEGKSPMRAMLGAGVTQAKDKVKGVFGGGGGGGRKGRGKKIKVTNIVEDIDVGVPVRVAYNQWTEFGSFPGFMKKVESVEHEADEKSNWKAQVFWSHRTWQATIREQVPEELIVWRSKGAKGHVDGAVTFHELTPDLTRILVVLEYHPQGLFERTGNLWRAQGRRVRLELKHFRRHVMTHTLLDPDEVEGWRGEIRDGEVVRTHEEALEQEQKDREAEEPEDEHEEEAGYEEEPEEGEFEEEEEPEDEEERDEDEEHDEEDEGEERDEDEEDEDEEDEGEEDEGEEEDEYEEPEEEYEEDEPAEPPRRPGRRMSSRAR